MNSRVCDDLKCHDAHVTLPWWDYKGSHDYPVIKERAYFRDKVDGIKRNLDTRVIGEPMYTSK